MHISSTQVLASHSNASASFPTREHRTLRSDGFVLVCITAACTLLAVAGVLITMEVNPDIFLMIAG